MSRRTAPTGTAEAPVRRCRILSNLIRLLPVAVLMGVVAQPSTAMAWGAQGHRVVARIAAERLTDRARAEVEELLGSPAADTMAAASTWADEIKRERQNTRPWHYIDLPVSNPAYDAAYCPNDACVVRQIELEIKTLSYKPAVMKPLRVDAVRFLIHFVGDEHMPLHCGSADDRGGNDIKVILAGRETNIHAVWDDDVVQHFNADTVPLARDLSGKITPKNAAAWAKGDARAWCVEAAKVSKTAIYDKLPGTGLAWWSPRMLPADYLDTSSPVAAEQLQKAGVRLAEVLNRVFK